jgi:hypothetical protein
MIRIRNITDEDVNTDYLYSTWGQTNDTMILEETKERSFVAAATDEPFKLELAFVYSQTKLAKLGEVKAKASASSGLRVAVVCRGSSHVFPLSSCYGFRTAHPHT